MKLIVVTAPTFFVEEDQIITALFEEGLDILHLRKPESPAMYSERLLTLIPAQYHKRIVTHEHFYLQEEFNLMGIHINSRNQNQPHDYSEHISCTCRSIQEIQNKKGYYDYMFLGSIYACNNGIKADFSPEELREARRRRIIDSKVMALGGITLDNILEIKDYGFGGAVITNDLWNKFDACNDQNYCEIINYFKKLKEMVD